MAETCQHRKKIRFALHELEGFVAICEAGSVQIAATWLHIAQPALTKKMRHLEMELDTKLFVKGHNKVTVTPAGERLFLKAHYILDLCRYVESEMGLTAHHVHANCS